MKVGDFEEIKIRNPDGSVKTARLKILAVAAQSDEPAAEGAAADGPAEDPPADPEA